MAERWERHTPRGRKLPEHVQHKKGALGGPGNDQGLEQSFASIASVFLRDKAPGLMDYLVGFQLLDRDEDDSRAVGIFGFKIGRQWLYCPVFYLNGDVKGTELMYLVGQKRFLPLKENWLNHLINRRPHVLGTSVSRNPSELGLRPPDLGSFGRNPLKYASHVALEFLPAAAAFARVLATPAPFPRVDLRAYLKEAGLPAYAALASLCAASPAIARAVDSYHDLGALLKEGREAAQEEKRKGVLGLSAGGRKYQPESAGSGARMSWGREAWDSVDPYLRKDVPRARYDERVEKAGQGVLEVRAAPPEKKGRVRVYTYGMQVSVDNELSRKEKEQLRQEGVVLRDTRPDDEVTRAYNLQTPLPLTNPTESGIYDVLVVPGKFERCLVLLAPYSDRGRQSFATVVALDDGRRWLNIHPSFLFIRQRPADEELNGSAFRGKDFTAWLEKQPALESLEPDGLYLLVGPQGQATVPFTPYHLEAGDGRRVYSARFDTYCERRREDHIHMGCHAHEPGSLVRGHYLVLGDRPGMSLRAAGGHLYVPPGFKKLTLRKPEEHQGFLNGPADGTEPAPLVPGTDLDIQQAIFGKTAALEVRSDGAAYVVNGGPSRPWLDALVHLVADVGLREDSAREILKEAAKKKKKVCRLKRADLYGDYELQRSSPGTVGFPEPPYTQDPMNMGGPTLIPQTVVQRMPQPWASNVAAQRPNLPPDPDPWSVQMGQQAAATGQQDVFDVNTLGSLLRSTRDETMIDKHVPKILDAINSYGELLLSLYWNGDKWQERFGKSDLPDLESSLKTLFEGSGDLALELMTRPVETYRGGAADSEIDEVGVGG